MTEEMIKNIFDKTMDCFCEYSYGYLEEGNTDNNMICVINDCNVANIYHTFLEWLEDWITSILIDLGNNLVYLSKQEYLYIYKLINLGLLHTNKTDVLENYFSEEDK